MQPRTANCTTLPRATWTLSASCLPQEKEYFSSVSCHTWLSLGVPFFYLVDMKREWGHEPTLYCDIYNQELGLEQPITCMLFTVKPQMLPTELTEHKLCN